MRNPTEELEDKLTELDPPYESLEELQIGRMLDRYGIPFFYRQPTVVYHQGQNEIWQPSFTLSSSGGLVVDYVAGSRQPHVPDALTREQIYAYNQIPAVVLARPTWTSPTGTSSSTSDCSERAARLRTRRGRSP